MNIIIYTVCKQIHSNFVFEIIRFWRISRLRKVFVAPRIRGYTKCSILMHLGPGHLRFCHWLTILCRALIFLDTNLLFFGIFGNNIITAWEFWVDPESAQGQAPQLVVLVPGGAKRFPSGDEPFLYPEQTFEIPWGWPFLVLSWRPWQMNPKDRRS